MEATLTATDSNRPMKKALQSAFPSVKFSCRLSRGTAYGNVSVSWVDGPSTQDVEKVTSRFEGMGFDGMTDSSYTKPTAIVIEGETFRSGLNLILTQRGNSPEKVAETIEMLKADGWSERFEGSFDCAASAILRGCSVLVAADHHHLAR